MLHRTVYITWHDETVRVNCTVSPGRRAFMSGSVDNWEPADPPTIEFDAIPPGVLDDDMPDFEDRVWNALADADEPDMDAAYDNWRNS